MPSSILIIADLEVGHLFPLFELAHTLVRRGHRVAFASVLDNQEYIGDQGLAFVPVLENDYPRGSRTSGRVVQTPDQGSSFEMLELVLGEEIDGLLESTAPKVVVMTTFLSLEALLIYYRFGIRPVLYTPYLVAGYTPMSEAYYKLTRQPMDKLIRFFTLLGSCRERLDPEAGLNRFIGVLADFRELIACPEELELPGVSGRAQSVHIGPAVRPLREYRPPKELLDAIRQGKKILYCSMGSQPARLGRRLEHLMDVWADLMQEDAMSGYHLVMSVGDRSWFRLPEIADRVTLYQWAPQLEILQMASLAIIHGGLGTIKECIYAGVPMLVLPGGYDQPQNAEKIVHHRLGLTADLEKISTGQLRTLIQTIFGDIEISARVKRMQEVFLQKEKEDTGAWIIEELLDSRSDDGY